MLKHKFKVKRWGGHTDLTRKDILYESG